MITQQHIIAEIPEMQSGSWLVPCPQNVKNRRTKRGETNPSQHKWSQSYPDHRSTDLKIRSFGSRILAGIFKEDRKKHGRTWNNQMSSRLSGSQACKQRRNQAEKGTPLPSKKATFGCDNYGKMYGRNQSENPRLHNSLHYLLPLREEIESKFPTPPR